MFRVSKFKSIMTKRPSTSAIAISSLFMERSVTLYLWWWPVFSLVCSFSFTYSLSYSSRQTDVNSFSYSWTFSFIRWLMVTKLYLHYWRLITWKVYMTMTLNSLLAGGVVNMSIKNILVPVCEVLVCIDDD